jgi:hypothetical protein
MIFTGFFNAHAFVQKNRARARAAISLHFSHTVAFFRCQPAQ